MTTTTDAPLTAYDFLAIDSLVCPMRNASFATRCANLSAGTSWIGCPTPMPQVIFQPDSPPLQGNSGCWACICTATAAPE